MADRVDAAMHLMQPAPREAMEDRPAPETQHEQLPAGDDAVLRPGEQRNPAIRVPSTHFAIYVVVKCVLGGHRPRLTAQSARVPRRS